MFDGVSYSEGFLENQGCPDTSPNRRPELSFESDPLPSPLSKGRREINWDGGNPNVLDTTVPVNAFLTFLNTRGSQFKTPGLGLSQAPPSGGPQGGLAVLFGNPTYGNIFKAFSKSRLFTPVGSNITLASFAIPGTNGNAPATVRGFGAVFTDVDQPDGTVPGVRRGNPRASERELPVMRLKDALERPIREHRPKRDEVIDERDVHRRQQQHCDPERGARRHGR